jgi:hypothetical protein
MHVLARYDNDIAIPGHGTGCAIRREQAQQLELERINTLCYCWREVGQWNRSLRNKSTATAASGPRIDRIDRPRFGPWQWYPSGRAVVLV